MVAALAPEPAAVTTSMFAREVTHRRTPRLVRNDTFSSSFLIEHSHPAVKTPSWICQAFPLRSFSFTVTSFPTRDAFVNETSSVYNIKLHAYLPPLPPPQANTFEITTTFFSLLERSECRRCPPTTTPARDELIPDLP